MVAAELGVDLGVLVRPHLLLQHVFPSSLNCQYQYLVTEYSVSCFILPEWIQTKMFCNRTDWHLETVFSITIFSLIYFKFLKLGNYCIFFFSRCHLQKHISSVNTHQLNKLGIISSNLVRTGTWNDRNKQRAWSGLFYGYSSNGDFPPPRPRLPTTQNTELIFCLISSNQSLNKSYILHDDKQ